MGKERPRDFDVRSAGDCVRCLFGFLFMFFFKRVAITKRHGPFPRAWFYGHQFFLPVQRWNEGQQVARCTWDAVPLKEESKVYEGGESGEYGPRLLALKSVIYGLGRVRQLHPMCQADGLSMGVGWWSGWAIIARVGFKWIFQLRVNIGSIIIYTYMLLLDSGLKAYYIRKWFWLGKRIEIQRCVGFIRMWTETVMEKS